VARRREKQRQRQRVKLHAEHLIDKPTIYFLGLGLAGFPTNGLSLSLPTLLSINK
jgi:hypothetical protein